MLRNSVKLFLMLCILSVGGGVVANAQVDSVAQIYANVPFAFTVGKTTLPAGRYEIRMPDDQVPNVLEMRNVNNHKAIMFNSENAQVPDLQVAKDTELVFDKVADQYFLSQVWVEGSSTGSELPKSKQELRLADSGQQPARESVAAMKR